MKPKIIFSDFDGTLTLGESLGPLFFDIISLLKSHKLELVLVSGRSLSCGHFFLTHFDFQFVIMEGGGAISFKGADGLIQSDYLVSERELKRLDQFSEKLIKKFTGLELTADSLGRITDRALELSLLSSLGIKGEVESFMDSENINHSTSSVHVNFWCGEISKMKAVRYYLEKEKKGIDLNECLFFGDARNDQSCFEGFKYSVGVSNIKEILNELTHRPKIVLEGEDQKGPLGVHYYLSKLLK